jgi:4-oxalocrotonate tautomerase
MVISMPIVHVFVWEGFSDDAKRRTIHGITNVFTELGIPREAVEVLIHELPMKNWGIGGCQASEKFKDVRIP